MTSRAIFRQSLTLILLAAIPAIIAAFVHRPLFSTPALAPDETSWEQVAAWQQQAQTASANSAHILLVDARDDDAYRHAHAPGALPLNEPRWEQQLPAVIGALRDNTRIAVYCDDTLCAASRSVAARLRRELALTDVLVIKDGWRASPENRHKDQRREKEAQP